VKRELNIQRRNTETKYERKCVNLRLLVYSITKVANAAVHCDMVTLF